MSQESTHCQNYTSVATGANVNLSEGDYLTVTVDGTKVVAVKIPTGLSGLAVYLGSTDAEFSAESGAFAEPDSNGVCWR